MDIVVVRTPRRGMDVRLADGTLYFSYFSQLCWIVYGSVPQFPSCTAKQCSLPNMLLSLQFSSQCYDYGSLVSYATLGQLAVDDGTQISAPVSP